jgi:hypothetical protein
VISKTLQRMVVASLCIAAASVSSLAAAQPPAASTDQPAPAPTEDDIVVRGPSPAELRVEIERQQDAFYARFNAINSTDDFDIVCREERPTGSNVPRRVCEPKFERNAQERAGRNTLNGLQGSGFSTGSGQFAGRAHYSHEQLETEIRKLSAEDPQLRETVARLVRLQQAYDDATKKSGEKKK